MGTIRTSHDLNNSAVVGEPGLSGRPLAIFGLGWYMCVVMACSEIVDSEREELAAFIESRWSGQSVVSKGRVYYPHKQPGLIERRNGQIVGVLTYHLHPDAMEILTLNSTEGGHGIGSSLVLSAIGKARAFNAERVWLTTTNDNLHAIGFYQRLGFRMIELNLDAVDEARKLKKSIPLVGERGIRIRDEIVMTLELEPLLDADADSSPRAAC